MIIDQDREAPIKTESSASCTRDLSLWYGDFRRLRA